MRKKISITISQKNLDWLKRMVEAEEFRSISDGIDEAVKKLRETKKE